MAGYIGNSPSDSSVRIARQIYTTSGITSDFTFTSGYDPGYIDIYVNGERQTEGTNFTASDGQTFTIMNGGVSTGSTVEASAYKTFNVATVTLGEVTDVDDLVITGQLTSGSIIVGSAVTANLSGLNVSGVVTATSFSGDGSALTGLASTDIINAEQVNVSGSTTTGIATVSTSIVVGSAVTVTATAININPTVTTTIGDSGNVDFNDDAKARFGTGNDLSIYHSGAHSFINDSGTGNLKILSSQVDILNPASNETIATFAENGAVALYYDNSVKLQTTTSGSYTTGIHTATSSLVAGDNADAGVDLRFRANRSSANQTIGNINGYWNDTVVGQIRFMAGEDTTNKDDCHLTFYTAAAGTVAERLRITSAGDILLGTDQATIGFNSDDGSDDKSWSLCGGSDASQNRGSLIGLFGNEHASFPGTLALRAGNVTGGRIEFSASGSEVARIDDSGRLLIGTTTEGSANADELTINTASGHGGITIRNDSSSNGNIYFSDGTSGAAEYAGYFQYDHNLDALRIGSGADLTLTLDSSHNATFAGTVSDSIGELRAIPENARGTTYTLVATDAGKCVTQTHSSGFTIDNSVFSAGDAVSMINDSGSDFTITQGSGVTLYNTVDASTGNRTLAGRGMATVWFQSASVGYISGAGLS